jgi:hypothetical protein
VLTSELSWKTAFLLLSRIIIFACQCSKSSYVHSHSIVFCFVFIFDWQIINVHIILWAIMSCSITWIYCEMIKSGKWHILQLKHWWFLCGKTCSALLLMIVTWLYSRTLEFILLSNCGLVSTAQCPFITPQSPQPLLAILHSLLYSYEISLVRVHIWVR